MRRRCLQQGKELNAANLDSVCNSLIEGLLKLQIYH